VLRRTLGHARAPISFSGIVLDPRITRVSRDGIPIELTPQEYRLLSYLAFNRGRVISQAQLTEHIYSDDIERSYNAIEVLVGRLRKRLGHGVIRTRRGFGYYVEAE
jgi:DNA-binding response OmpR family regulator